MKRKLIPILLAALLLFTAACQSATDASSPGEESSGAESVGDESVAEGGETPEPVAALREEIPFVPVATLSNNVINSTEFVYHYLTTKSETEYMAMMYYGVTDMEGYWNQEVDGASMHSHMVNQVLSALKELAVLYQTAVDNGVTLSAQEESDIEADIQGILTDLGDDKQTFLNTYGLTMEQMTDVAKRITLMNKFYQAELDSMAVSDSEISAAYEENKDQYETVTVRHVLIPSDDSMTEEERAAAKTTADDVLAQLQGGAEIGQLAAQYSQDPGSKDNNGEYTFGRGEMVKEFEDWSYAAQPGDTGMVETTYGYHIMEFISRNGMLEEVREALESTLKQEKFLEAYAEQYALVNSEDWQLDNAMLETITGYAVA